MRAKIKRGHDCYVYCRPTNNSFSLRVTMKVAFRTMKIALMNVVLKSTGFRFDLKYPLMSHCVRIKVPLSLFILHYNQSILYLSVIFRRILLVLFTASFGWVWLEGGREERGNVLFYLPRGIRDSRYDTDGTWNSDRLSLTLN